MNDLRKAVACGAAPALLGIGTTIGGLGSAAAQPNDYRTLPVDPNLVTDSLAYNAAPPVFDPSGQPGDTIDSGMSPDGTKSVTVLTFTQGNAAATIESDGPPRDPAPADLELGQKQDTAITDWQAA
jgi:hypothetical protein